MRIVEARVAPAVQRGAEIVGEVATLDLIETAAQLLRDTPRRPQQRRNGAGMFQQPLSQPSRRQVALGAPFAEAGADDAQGPVRQDQPLDLSRTDRALQESRNTAFPNDRPPHRLDTGGRLSLGPELIVGSPAGNTQDYAPSCFHSASRGFFGSMGLEATRPLTIWISGRIWLRG